MYWLLAENCVLYANILVFMLIHTELFSNMSGLNLIHCGLGLEKNFGPLHLTLDLENYAMIGQTEVDR